MAEQIDGERTLTDRFGDMAARPGVRLTLAASAVLDRFASLLAPHSLTPSRVLALSFIDNHPGCDQNALARGLGITKASAMSVIDRLESFKLVERSSGANRRSNALHLTDGGRAAFAESLRLERGLSEWLYGWMDQDSLAEFLAALDEITRRAERCGQRDGN